jgi:hypothetical protein
MRSTLRNHHLFYIRNAADISGSRSELTHGNTMCLELLTQQELTTTAVETLVMRSDFSSEVNLHIEVIDA